MTDILIRCKIEREGGTPVTLDGITYHFKPRPDLGSGSAHVCLLNKKPHINRLLSITEGYEVYLGDDDVDGFDADLSPAVPDDGAVDQAADGMAEDPPEEDSEDGEDGDEIDSLPDSEQDLKPLDDMSDDELRDEYKIRNGRAARKNTSRQTLIDKLRDLRAV